MISVSSIPSMVFILISSTKGPSHFTSKVPSAALVSCVSTVHILRPTTVLPFASSTVTVTLVIAQRRRNKSGVRRFLISMHTVHAQQRLAAYAGDVVRQIAGQKIVFAVHMQ